MSSWRESGIGVLLNSVSLGTEEGMSGGMGCYYTSDTFAAFLSYISMVGGVFILRLSLVRGSPLEMPYCCFAYT